MTPLPKVHRAAELSVNKEVLQLCVKQVPFDADGDADGPFGDGVEPNEGLGATEDARQGGGGRAPEGIASPGPPTEAPLPPPKKRGWALRGAAIHDCRANWVKPPTEVWIAARCNYEVQILRARAKPTPNGRYHW